MTTRKEIQSLIKRLETYALSLKGTTREIDGAIEVVVGSWPTFFDVDYEPVCVARLPIKETRFREIARQYSEVKKSEWGPRDGHIYMEVSLDGQVPEKEFKEWIDEAHQLILDKLDDEERFIVLVGDRPYDENLLINDLVEFNGLSDMKAAVKRTAKAAILLQSHKATEKNIPIGASKLGGNPDLLPTTAWPTHSSGRPLSFLTQFDLKELARVGSPFKNLPTTGTLAVFSVWGWMVDGDADPHVPEEAESPEWTQCIYLKPSKKLERRPTPKGTHRFKAASLELVPIRSFPIHSSEPSVAKLGLTSDQCRRFEKFASTFRKLQLRSLIPKSHGSSHQLGGYGLFQQCLPELIEQGTSNLFLQLGTDDWASDTMWGDGGELALIASVKDLQKGSLEALSGELQGG